MLDLQPIKYRLSTATPGPWRLDVTYFQPRSIWARVGKLFSADDATFGDCDLIAHAPTDLTALVAEVERLKTQIAEDWSRMAKLETGIALARRNRDQAVVVAQELRAAINAHREASQRVPKSEADEGLWSILDD